MKKITFILLCSLVGLTAFAQRNYKPGYIITYEKDSIVGLIDFRSSINMSYACRFKQNPNEKEKEYLPGEIEKFGFIEQKELFVSRVIHLNDTTKRTAFVRRLVEGKMSLSFYRDEYHLRDFYFFENNGENIGITKFPDIIEDGKVYPDMRYAETLKYIFRDKLDIIGNKKIGFNKQTMISLVEQYNSSDAGDVNNRTEIYSSQKRQAELGVTLYYGLSMLKYKTYSLNEHWVIAANNATTIGGRVNLILPRWINFISLHADVSVTNLDGNAENLSLNYIMNIKTYKKLNMKAKIVSGEIGAGYIYPRGIFRPAVELAFQQSFITESESSMYLHKDYGDTFDEITRINLILPKDYLIGYNLRAGFNIQIAKNHSILFRAAYFETYNKDKYSGLQFKLGYTFNFSQR